MIFKHIFFILNLASISNQFQYNQMFKNNSYSIEACNYSFRDEDNDKQNDPSLHNYLQPKKDNILSKLDSIERMMARQYEIGIENKRILKQQSESIMRLQKQVAKLQRIIEGNPHEVVHSRLKSQSLKSCRTKRSSQKAVLNCIQERKKIINECTQFNIQNSQGEQTINQIQSRRKNLQDFFFLLNRLYYDFIIINNMQNEYIDLPINIQQTPKQLLQKVEPYKLLPSDKPSDVANNLLKTLEVLIKGSSIDLYIFYQNTLPTVQKQLFTDKQWPSPSDLQKQLDNQYKPGAQTIYKQFALRSGWAKVKAQKDVQKYCDSIDQYWEQYTSIFKLEYGRINFPPEMVWDYFDHFLQIYLFHRSKISGITQSKKYNQQNFDAQETKSMFKQLLKSLPHNFTSNPTTKQVFAYYSLVALAVIAINEENYKQALSYIEKISLKDTIIFSKAIGSLLSAFLAATFSYFMLQQYNKSVKLCETVVSFYHKYRKFFDKSQNYFTRLQPLFQKLVILQCVNYVFLEEKPKTTSMQIFKNTNVKTKEKQSRDKISDCFTKMKQNDASTFWRMFNYIAGDYSLSNTQTLLVERFKKLQSVNINTIIQNYRRIQLEKISKMIGISTEEVLKKFKSIEQVEKSQSPWVTTILNPLLKQKKKVNVLIEGNIAIFDSLAIDADESSREWERYRQQIGWLNEKVKTI